MAARIPETVIEQVRTSANIVDVIGQYVTLNKQGKNWFGLCPFQAEKTPSFSVNEEKQIYYCFSCHRGGNVFSFLMDLNGVSFTQAVAQVAQSAGIFLDAKYLPSANQKVNRYQQLYDLYEQAQTLYHHILVNTKAGEAALQYLIEKRHLTMEQINQFGLGYAPEEPLLKLYFKERNVDFQVLRKSGLFAEKQDGTLSDRFYARVMYPVRDEGGRVIAFSGRTMARDKNIPKYLNSPETPLFNKRKTLYNFDKAKAAIRQSKTVTLCEGFMDVMAVYFSGRHNVVASMGTSLTEEQVDILSHHAKNVEICYDGDEPGQAAIKRAITLFEAKNHFNISVVTLPDGLDPDEYLRKYGQAQLAKKLADNAKTPLDFYLQYYELGRDLTNENDQLAYLSDVLAVLVNEPDALVRDLYLNRLTARFHLDKAVLVDQLTKLAAQMQKNHNAQRAQQEQMVPPTQAKPANAGAPAANSSINSAPKKYSRVEQAERLLLYRALHDSSVWLQLTSMPQFSFVHEKYQALYVLAGGYFNLYQRYSIASFVDYIQDDGLKQVALDLDMASYNPQTSENEVEDCIDVIMNQAPLVDQINQVKHQLEEAIRYQDEPLISKLTNQYIKLLKQKQTTSSN